MLLCCCCLLCCTLWAHRPSTIHKKRVQASYLDVCANSEAQIDQEINNVRARLLAGGDFWWNFKEGSYIAPKPIPGTPGVSAFTAGSIWMGGIDPGGNLKVAANDYRTGANPLNAYWPGPLDEATGGTEKTTCKRWDRHFRVTADEVRLHLDHLKTGNLNPADIPAGIKRWPARGNPYFEEIYGFSLPNTTNGLADFYDQNGDEVYKPLDGDYPIVRVQSCQYELFPDEMIFWIYNDQGGRTAQTVGGGTALQMEVQATAFSFKTNDELNDMTFQRHKFIYRGEESIDSLFFAVWTDPDLGCPFDD